MKQVTRQSFLVGFAIAAVALLVIAATTLNRHNNQRLDAQSIAMPSHEEWNKIPQSAMEALKGQTLHWFRSYYYYSPDLTDPANGQILTAEFWAQLDDSLAPVKYHKLTTFPSGVFRQEELLVDGKQYVIFGSGITQSQPPQDGVIQPSLGRCAEMSSIDVEPILVYPDRVLARQLGFQVESGTLPRSRANDGVPGLQSIQVLESNGSLERFFKRQPLGSRDVRLEEFALTPEGRLASERVRITDSAGRLLAERWLADSDVHVYQSQSVPSSTFILSKIGQEACRG